MSTADLYRRSLDEFGRRVDGIRDDQWEAPTPCTDWNVRELVNHLVYENMWVPLILAGKRVEEVGDALDGDLLGRDPKGTWERSVKDGLIAAEEEGVLDRTVHVSFGDLPGHEYVTQVASDLVIHAWDLARAIGADESLDLELIEMARDTIAPMAEGGREHGIYGDEVEVGDDADPQTRLLALSGRNPRRE